MTTELADTIKIEFTGPHPTETVGIVGTNLQGLFSRILKMMEDEYKVSPFPTTLENIRPKGEWVRDDHKDSYGYYVDSRRLATLYKAYGKPGYDAYEAVPFGKFIGNFLTVEAGKKHIEMSKLPQ